MVVGRHKVELVADVQFRRLREYLLPQGFGFLKEELQVRLRMNFERITNV